jgi:selenide, water dikinase
LAIVFTADFFAPLVDDAFLFGEIAAANALSDIYAMGAQPLLALNLVGWPRDELPFDLLQQVLAGGDSIVRSAGAWTAGGHSIDDREPKYGLAVVGIVSPDEIWMNSTARAGDALVLTKPLGTGIAVTALKQDRCPPELFQEAVSWMRTTNEQAARIARQVGGVRAATDVTGFGLLGHLMEICKGSQLSADLNVTAIPLLTQALEMAHAGAIAGGTRRNLEAVSSMLEAGSHQDNLWPLVDAQTSGGLLLSVVPDKLDTILEAMHAEEIPAAHIGNMADGPVGIRLR